MMQEKIRKLNIIFFEMENAEMNNKQYEYDNAQKEYRALMKELQSMVRWKTHKNAYKTAIDTQTGEILMVIDADNAITYAMENMPFGILFPRMSEVAAISLKAGDIT